MTQLATVPAVAPASTDAISPPADAMLVMIERMARDPTVDIDKLQRLMDMRERTMTKQAEALFNAAMSAAQSAIAPVVRNRRNEHSRSTYADLAQIADIALPIIHRHGFALTFVEFETPKPGYLGVACIVRHAGGHSERHEFHVPLDSAGSQGKVNKTPTQAYGSTYQYARRYATCGVFNITTSEHVRQDRDGSPATITDDQATALRDLIESVGADIPAFLKYFKVERLGDLLSTDYDRAIAALRKKGAKP